MAKRTTDTERLERIKKLGVSDEEALEILAYDKAVEAGEKTEFDLDPEKAKTAQKFAHAGTRKAPAVYKWDTPKRKPNATKSGIIAELADFLENHSEFETSDIQVVNKEREILLKIGGEWYSVVLQYKRNMNKG